MVISTQDLGSTRDLRILKFVAWGSWLLPGISPRFFCLLTRRLPGMLESVEVEAVFWGEFLVGRPPASGLIEQRLIVES